MRDRTTIEGASKFTPPQTLVLEVLLDLREMLAQHTADVREAAERLDTRERTVAERLRQLEGRGGFKR